MTFAVFSIGTMLVENGMAADVSNDAECDRDQNMRRNSREYDAPETCIRKERPPKRKNENIRVGLTYNFTEVSLQQRVVNTGEFR